MQLLQMGDLKLLPNEKGAMESRFFESVVLSALEGKSPVN